MSGQIGNVAAVAEGVQGADILFVQQAILRLLPVAEAEPVAKEGAPDGGFTRLYFNHLKK
jgi:hypothetical protein